MQTRYDSRLQSQEELLQKLTKENTDFRHKNELLKIDITDLEFKISRLENNEKMMNSNPELEQVPTKILEERLKSLNQEYNELLMSVDGYSNKVNELGEEIIKLTDEKKEAFMLVEKKRLKIRLAEDKIRTLEDKVRSKQCE